MRRAMWLATVAAVALGPVRAAADTLGGTYRDDVVERGHTVRVERRGDRAVFAVRRVLANRDIEPEELTLRIELPTAAVATGFRHRLGGAWMDGVLMSASKAEAEYDRLTADGARRARGPALMTTDGGGDSLEVKLYPAPRRGTVAIEYTLEAPLCYAAGHYLTDYPWATRDDERMVVPSLSAPRGARVVDRDGLGALLPDADLDNLCAGIGFQLTADKRFLVMPGPRITGPARVRFGHYRIDDGHRLVRVDVAVPKVIEPAPRGARVVFAIDASHSVGTGGIRDQLELISGYLDHVPDARVEIVVYRRLAHRLFGRFVPARSLASELVAVHPHRLAPGNGSNLDAGLALAAQLLAGARGPARVVAFTDDALRARFDVGATAALAAALPPQAVLHVVDLEGGGGSYGWSRDDDHRLFDIARARGGVVADMRGSGGGPDSARDAMLGLVRPLTIDQLELTVPGVDEDQLSGLPDAFAGGDGYRDMAMATAAPDGAELRGAIWSRPWRVPLVADAALSARLPRLAFGHEVWARIPEDRLYEVAMAAGVVSTATSFLSRDRDAPPTTHQPRGGIGHMFTCSCGGVRSASIRCGIGHAGRIRGLDEPDRNAILRALLADGVRTCAGPRAGGVKVSVETTGYEIVDVAVDGAGGEVAACIAEAAWALALPAEIYGGHSGAYVAAF